MRQNQQPQSPRSENAQNPGPPPPFPLHMIRITAFRSHITERTEPPNPEGCSRRSSPANKQSQTERSLQAHSKRVAVGNDHVRKEPLALFACCLPFARCLQTRRLEAKKRPQMNPKGVPSSSEGLAQQAYPGTTANNPDLPQRGCVKNQRTPNPPMCFHLTQHPAQKPLRRLQRLRNLRDILRPSRREVGLASSPTFGDLRQFA